MNTTPAVPPTWFRPKAELGLSLGVGVLVAVSANAGSLAGTVALPLVITGGSIMPAAALLVALVLIVPGERAVRRNSRNRP
ncbi:hypothetical protein ACS5PJ_15340 [Pseudarthrobacter sp. YS3]|uniref:hypothetical protein n=1 Tax=Pseudarthrobacter sp. YS3 TaxID=3453718 RepID=UPI003EE946DA